MLLNFLLSVFSQKLNMFKFSCTKQALYGKILDLFRLKVFLDVNLTVTQKSKFALGRVENIVGKGENAGYQHFLLFLQCFQKAFSLGLLKVWIVL